MSTNHSRHQSSVRDVPSNGSDKYARESFTWRRMQPWQIWTLASVATVVFIAGFLYLM